MNDNEHPYGLVECFRFGKIYGLEFSSIVFCVKFNIGIAEKPKWKWTKKKHSANGKRYTELKICKCFVMTHNRKLATMMKKEGITYNFLMKQHVIDISLSTESIANENLCLVPWTTFKCIAHTSIILKINSH